MKETEAASALRGREAADAALLARIAAGEVGDDMRDLCERYTPRLYGFGLRLLGDAGMAEEMVQDTFVRVWRGAAGYDPDRGSVRTFIYTIARRSAIDLQRRTRSRPLAALREDPSGAPEVGVDDQTERIATELEVRDALDALSPDHRRALELHYFEDLTQREIAERLGIPLGTVKTRTYHALRALRAMFEERELIA